MIHHQVTIDSCLRYRWNKLQFAKKYDPALHNYIIQKAIIKTSYDLICMNAT